MKLQRRVISELQKIKRSSGLSKPALGITPGWGGGALLCEKMPTDFAYQWLMAAIFVMPHRSRKAGWIHKIIVTDNWNDQEKLLKTYLSKSEAQMKILKNQYKKRLSIHRLSTLMDEEVRNCAKLWDSPEHKKALEQFDPENNGLGGKVERYVSHNDNHIQNGHVHGAPELMRTVRVLYVQTSVVIVFYLLTTEVRLTTPFSNGNAVHLLLQWSVGSHEQAL